jgi:nicotinate phosphoribosyltransferase
VLLDQLGAVNTRILVTSDLDEYVIAALVDAPIDGYGVGTRVATGSGHPTAGMVYKLVAIGDSPYPGTPMRSVAKTAAGKASAGGLKTAYRRVDANGVAVEEVVVVQGEEPGAGRPLQAAVFRAGSLVDQPDLAAVRRHHESARAELPPAALAIAEGDAALVATPREATT